ncbi:immunity protein Imm33 domain-containing protein [Paraburkholderia dinghuensis]|uniref:Imm33-like domain-containing protein n=1 Tax=Paraburkholderia dinghuensis TaxID=2305225 RepID=A0A3N6P405_9BURK|nr:hypothetical protein [Paraburkholderia dinghuensis]RQH08313.1 hypothetical protein D1Y85_04655 [Paraburkholderia dinghuensis]
MKNKSDTLEDLQKETCRKYDLSAIAPEGTVAVALDTIGKFPIYGERVALKDGEEVSWFFHCKSFFSKVDSYKSVQTEQLKDILPAASKFLGLPHGSGFVLDAEGNEQVWAIQNGAMGVRVQSHI